MIDKNKKILFKRCFLLSYCVFTLFRYNKIVYFRQVYYFNFELENTMILSCNQIKKSFGDQIIISNGSFHIEDQEKVALVGLNGAGKSTLLKIIMQKETLDDGTITISKDKTIGYLSQHQEMTSNYSILEEISTAKQSIIDLEEKVRQLEHNMKHLQGDALENALEIYHKSVTSYEHQNGYAYRSEIVGVLKGLGFLEDEFDKKVSTLSGGQKTRVSLGKLLLTKPDILLLDEPTNHLDINSILWLETFLMNYSGAVLIVSHDRYFINRIVTKVIEIEHGQLSVFSGNYNAFAQKKALMQEIKIKEYYKQQQEIKHQEKVITKLKSFNREKSIRRAESREKSLAKIERIEKPITDEVEMHFQLTPNIMSGNDVLSVSDLNKSFSKVTLFHDVSFEIKRKERIAIIGDNGSGKTTLLKIINEIIPADSGRFTLGSNVCIGYYDQEHHVLHMDKTIFQEISDEYPEMNNTQIRNTLAAFLFTGDDVYKPIHSLSGGERGRVSLAKLMLSDANFLILDEPTNHLDIVSKEILERVLSEYEGTVLYVSHDRYFINKTCTRILELSNQNFINYIGNYDYYLEKKDILNNIAFSPSSTVVSTTKSDSTSNLRSDWKMQKEEQAAKRKRESAFKKIEASIMKLEERDQEIDTLLQNPEIYSNVQECLKLTSEKNKILEELEQLYAEWEDMSM